MQVMHKNEMKVPAKIWVDNLANVESGALDQAELVCSQDWVKHASFMPDIHVGHGCTIGAVIATENVVCPRLVGVDIGCGMCVIDTGIPASMFDSRDLSSLISEIKKVVPMGFDVRQSNPANDKELLSTVPEFKDAVSHEQLIHKSSWFSLLKHHKSKNIQNRVDLANHYLGTLGGGNHFIELQKDENDILHIMLHSGSRGVGEAIAQGFMKIAKELNQLWHTKTTKELDILPLEATEGMLYIEAVDWAQTFAYFNRFVMMEEIKRVLTKYCKARNYQKPQYDEMINIHHNYVNIEHHHGQNLYVHRKGATRVRDNIIGIIPGSMGTKSYIVRGTNNIDSLNSCSHGAGRTMSRTKAKANLTLKDFTESMKGIVSHNISKSHIDEAPAAYKDIDMVMNNQKDLVTIVKELTPIANIKG